MNRMGLLYTCVIPEQDTGPAHHYYDAAIACFDEGLTYDNDMSAYLKRKSYLKKDYDKARRQ
ncbi:MAG: hypothetical protein WAK17_24445 [Candidatus Nitrosopolaris sp.]